MDHKAQLENKKYRNWVRAGLGIKYVKEGLEPFCDYLVKQQHVAILDEVKRKHNLSTVSCGHCDIRTLLPDHGRINNRQCPLGQFHCNCLHLGGKTSCPNNVCGAIYDEIITRHASTPPAPYWRNTDVHQWCTEPWAVAKCFINAPGYEHKTRATEFDCSGLLHLLINNLEFHQHIQCAVSGNDAFSRVRQHRNAIYHCSKMELEDLDFTNYVNDMIDLLQDDKEIKGRQESKEAVKKLLELKQEKFIMTTTDETEVRRIALAAIEEKEKSLDQKIADATNEIGVKTDESQQQIKEIVSTITDELAQKQVEMKNDLRKTEINLFGRLKQREKKMKAAQKRREVESTNLKRKQTAQNHIEDRCSEDISKEAADDLMKSGPHDTPLKSNYKRKRKGHDNVQSLDNYRGLTNRQQQQISSIISSSDSTSEKPSTINQAEHGACLDSATLKSNDITPRNDAHVVNSQQNHVLSQSSSSVTFNSDNRPPAASYGSVFHNSIINGGTFNINVNLPNSSHENT